MPTPGPWQATLQLSVPAFLQEGGRERVGVDATDTFHPGVTSAAEVNMLVNGRRGGANGGTVSALPPSAGTVLESRCEVDVFYDSDIDGTHVTTGFGHDQGWWFGANLTAGWADYLSALVTAMAAAGAVGYEVEGGSSIHIVSVDGADISIPMVLIGSMHPMVSMEVSIYTTPAADYTDLPAPLPTPLPPPHETRVLTTSYGVGSEDYDITETIAPIILALSASDLDPAAGGVQVFPNSTQAGDLPEWDVGSGLSSSQTEHFPQIWFHSEGTVTGTYDVTFPRYRLLFDEPVAEPVESVTRQFPRDDAYGLGSAPRIFPPPRGGRLVGGYQ